MRLKIILGCEFSGVNRDAFHSAGHDATSCDLLPTEKPGKHVVGNILELLDQGWDMAIFNPPCTYLCNSGVRWLSSGGKLDPDRHTKMKAACDFFAALYWADIPRVCIENPVMHKYARDYLWSAWKVPSQSQTIQPYEHGHGETKRTALWLRNLPLLKPSNVVNGRTPRVHFAPPGLDRWKERSRTLPGIAKAMVAQWGK